MDKLEGRKIIVFPLFLVLALAFIGTPAVSAWMHQQVYFEGYIYKNGYRYTATMYLFEPFPPDHGGIALGYITCIAGSIDFCINSYSSYRNIYVLQGYGSPHNIGFMNDTTIRLVIYHSSPYIVFAYGPDFVFVGRWIMPV